MTELGVAYVEFPQTADCEIFLKFVGTLAGQWRGGRGGGAGGHRLPNDNFLGALKSKGGAKIRNCQREISYKICKVQIANKFKVVVILAFL